MCEQGTTFSSSKTFYFNSMPPSFPQVYVSDCIGVRWVGLVLMTYGLSSGLGGLVSGRLVKHVPQYLITYTASLVSLGIFLFHLFWVPAPVYYVQFMVVSLIGLCEGSLSAVTASELGTFLVVPCGFYITCNGAVKYSACNGLYCDESLP